MRDIWLLMKAVMRSARHAINARLEPLGLTSAEGDVLYHLLADLETDTPESHGEGLTQDQLATRLDVDKAAISRTIDALVKKGFVHRERRPDDARAYRLTLTAQAIAARADIEHAYNSVYAAITRGIPATETERLATLLRQVANNLEIGE